MEIKRYVVLVMLCLFSSAILSPLRANDEDVKKQINRIKTNEAYVAAEATGEKLQDAYDMALMNVYFSINSQRILQGFPPVDLEKIRPLVHSLSVKRGSMTRVLVYIDWSDIEVGASSSNVVEETRQDKESNVDTIEVVLAIPLTSAVNNADSTFLTSKDESGAEAVSTTSKPEKTSTPTSIVTSDSEAIEDVLASLGMTEMIVDGVQQLAAFKMQQMISGYGRFDQTQQVDGNIFLLLFDRTRVIRGILEKRSDGTIRNIRTNELDSLDNYKDCKAYWFK